MDKEKLYEEVGNNYRFFARWRHFAFVGNIVVVGAVLTLCASAYKEAKEIIWLIPLFASPIGVMLWIVDVRTVMHVHIAIDTGIALEGDGMGFYTQLNSLRSPSGISLTDKFSHSLVMKIAFLGSSMVLLVLSGCLFYNLTYTI